MNNQKITLRLGQSHSLGIFVGKSIIFSGINSDGKAVFTITTSGYQSSSSYVIFVANQKTFLVSSKTYILDQIIDGGDRVVISQVN